MTNMWIFSRTIDLLTFTGTALIAIALLAIAPLLGISHDSPGDAPTWTWIIGVLLVDVAHVWSTVFVTYLDPFERARRPLLYVATPIISYIALLLLYQCGSLTFWRVIAYLAVFHFVRQQYGWVMMYRARANQRHRWGRRLDATLIYLTMTYPLIAWHATLPRHFWWMRESDFVTGMPSLAATMALVAYSVVAITYIVVNAFNASKGHPITWGKHLMMITTAACWYIGIVGTNSDYKFTVTNVLIHGAPYMVLVFIYGRRAAIDGPIPLTIGHQILRWGWPAFVATLWAIAYVEELLWDHAAWHEHQNLFGSSGLGAAAALVIPALATPQIVHYVLDGFLWRRSNPRLTTLLPAR
jgi:hypothetical protein